MIRKTAKIKVDSKTWTYEVTGNVNEGEFVVVDLNDHWEIGQVIDVNDTDNYNYSFSLKECNKSFKTKEEAKAERGKIVQHQEEILQELEERKRNTPEYTITLNRKKSFKGGAISYSVSLYNEKAPNDFGSGDTIVFRTKNKHVDIYFRPLKHPIGGYMPSHTLQFDINNEDVFFNFEMAVFPTAKLVLKEYNAKNVKFS